MNTTTSFSPVPYRIGIDVGTHSIGFCAVSVDEKDFPVEFLSLMVHVHDSGLDPSGNKKAETRKLVSGAARRLRRLYRVRRRRLTELDRKLAGWGYPIVDLESEDDPLLPWRVRARLANAKVDDEIERDRLLSIALRHIARHRGWRSPYSRLDSLLAPTEDSTLLKSLRERIEGATGVTLPVQATPAQCVTHYIDHHPLSSIRLPKLRGPEGILGGKLMQSDNANELRRIANVQGLDTKHVEELIRTVFQAKSPKGSARDLVGRDPLPGQGRKIRAEKAHPVFQLFRQVATLTNLRIHDAGIERHLTPEELQGCVDFLQIVGDHHEPTWGDLANQLGIRRQDLRGTARPSIDGEAALTRPPTDRTSHAIATCGIPWLVKWWAEADTTQRSNMIDALSNSGGSLGDGDVDDEVAALLELATEADHEKLDKLSLPSGRAAYSLDSLTRLTEEMLATGCDLHDARKTVFGVDNSWTPPAEPIGTPVGNPAVDRVLKQVSRWLEMCIARWGAPLSINIEHVRNALGSERVIREALRESARRERELEKIYADMHKQLGLSGTIHRSARLRFSALQRQNCQCLYCGDMITFETLEMDHIVPRANGASTNTRNNLVAVCRSCNHSKGKLPFALWARSGKKSGVSLGEVAERVRMWTRDPDVSAAAFRKFQADVLTRLKCEEPDEELDARSLESVAWMANELRHRVEQRFKSSDMEVPVRVYRGVLTAIARRASGFESRVNLLGGGGKTRFDRRHHAMDALTIALINPSIAQTIAWRENLREAQQVKGQAETWRTYMGTEGIAQRKWHNWIEAMVSASELFNLALLKDDGIPITENTRLRLGSGAVHKASILKFESKDQRALGDALDASLIDRAATPALWTALTRLPEFDPKSGLPEDPQRHIVVNGKHLTSSDTVNFFPTSAASISVRGGHAQLGDSIHHARIYRIAGRKTIYGMIRVYQVDLVRHRDGDLFTVPLPLSSISVRSADKKVREALASGTATQIGFLVEGDELVVDPHHWTTDHIGDFFHTYPQCTRWRVAGFYDTDRLRLYPRLLSAEGLPSNATKGVTKIVKVRGWIATVNKLLASQDVRVVRRNALGEERIFPSPHLPFSQLLV